MGSKKRQILKSNAAGAKPVSILSGNAAQFRPDMHDEGNNARVFVSLRLVDYEWQCFSEWTCEEMKAFWSFQEKIHKCTWQEVYASGGKENKNGFAYTPIDADKYRSEWREKFSLNTTYFELRVNQTMRVHGFREGAIFYICWLDRSHAICP